MQVTRIPIMNPRFGLLLINVALSRYMNATKRIDKEKKIFCFACMEHVLLHKKDEGIPLLC